MGILNNKTFYAKVWQEEYRENFSQDDIDMIESIEIVAGNFGISARVETNEGDAFYPIHRDSVELAIGDKLDPAMCTIIHLKRGEARTEKLLYNGAVINK